jgi:hypothetical protein
LTARVGQSLIGRKRTPLIFARQRPPPPDSALASLTVQQDTRRSRSTTQRIVTELVDDIDGSKAEETVRFAIDGVEYEVV